MPTRSLADSGPGGARPGFPRFHRVKVLRRLPHPDRGFTQGLLADGDTVWESTGHYGQSALRALPARPASGGRRAAALPAELFGEGICRVGPHIWQLTWRERVALRWDAAQPDAAGHDLLQPRGLGHLHRRSMSC